MKVDQLDELGLSVLIKACDRTSNPKKAVEIVCKMLSSDFNIDQSIFDRIFAIFVRTRHANLAVRFLLHLEKLTHLQQLQRDVGVSEIEVRTRVRSVCTALKHYELSTNSEIIHY